LPVDPVPEPVAEPPVVDVPDAGVVVVDGAGLAGAGVGAAAAPLSVVPADGEGLASLTDGFSDPAS
jgi:hypothetical protein